MGGGASRGLHGFNDGLQVRDGMQPERRLGRAEFFGGEWPPGGGRRSNPCCFSGMHVVCGITDKQCAIGRELHLIKREQHRVGQRLVADRRFDRHLDVKHSREANVCKGPLRHSESLAGHETQGMSARFRPRQSVEYARVNRGQLIEVLGLKLAIPGEQCFDVVGLGRPLRNLDTQRLSDAGCPCRHSRAMCSIGKRVFHALDKQIDGVDQGAVEVEQ